MALNESGEMVSGALADLLGLAPSTMARFLDRLATRGLVTRRSEGRLAMAAITDQGRAMMPDLQVVWKRLLAAYCDLYRPEVARDLNMRIAAANRSLDG